MAGKAGDWFAYYETTDEKSGAWRLVFSYGRVTVPFASWPSVIKGLKDSGAIKSDRGQAIINIAKGLRSRNIKSPIAYSKTGAAFALVGTPVEGRNTCALSVELLTREPAIVAASGALLKRMETALKKGTDAIHGLKGNPWSTRYGPCFMERRRALKSCSVALLEGIKGIPGAFNVEEGSGEHDKMAERWKPYRPDTSKTVATDNATGPKSAEEEMDALLADVSETADDATDSLDETAATVEAATVETPATVNGSNGN